MRLLRFIVLLTVLAVLIVGLAKGLAHWLSPMGVLSPNFFLLVIFLYFLTIIVYFLSLWGLRKGAEYSVYSILGGIVIKMLMSLSLILYLFIKSPENQKVLALNFFSLYFLFTVFEVTVMLRNLRDQNKK